MARGLLYTEKRRSEHEGEEKKEDQPIDGPHARQSTSRELSPLLVLRGNYFCECELSLTMMLLFLSNKDVRRA